jgi:hypothetical protein
MPTSDNAAIDFILFSQDIAFLNDTNDDRG